MSAEVRPSVAVVGQQILYRVRIVRRQDVEAVDWVRGLSFPDFRAEWLPGRAEDTQMHYRGMTFVAREEERALFPTHAGVFEIPEASLRCTIRGRGPTKAQSEIVRIAPVRVRVIDPPEQERPDDFSGAVGPIWIQTSIGADEIHLGQSLSVSILVRGGANLWDLPAPLREEDFDAEVFVKPPSIELEAGDKLYLRRYYRFEVVPRKTGPLVIPAIRIPYYDVRTGHYAVSQAEAIQVTVLPREGSQDISQQGRPERKANAANPLVDPKRSRPAEDGSPLSGWVVAAGLSFLCLAIALGAGSIRRRRRWAPTREALADAEAARTAKDARAEVAALSHALYGAVALLAPELDTSSPKALRAGAALRKDDDLASAADAIEALERSRFSAATDPADCPNAIAAVERLRRRSSRW